MIKLTSLLFAVLVVAGMAFASTEVARAEPPGEGLTPTLNGKWVFTPDAAYGQGVWFDTELAHAPPFHHFIFTGGLAQGRPNENSGFFDLGDTGLMEKVLLMPPTAR